jgi:hypothetical protein
MNYNPDDPRTWPCYRTSFIAHDVGRSRDRSTAVIGGNSPCGQRLLGIGEAVELPLNLFGTARASALAAFDRKYFGNSLILADVSNDASYLEVLFETFGRRVIGIHISRHGDGMNFEWRSVKGGQVLVYTVGRTHLIDLLLGEFQSGVVKFSDSEMMRRAYEQLANLEAEYRDTGLIYTCPPGHHDDLGISCAMLAWAARHKHLQEWMRYLPAAQGARKRRPSNQQAGWAPHI